jgi:hypothetical protein
MYRGEMAVPVEIDPTDHEIVSSCRRTPGEL